MQMVENQEVGWNMQDSQTYKHKLKWWCKLTFNNLISINNNEGSIKIEKQPL